MQKLTFKIKINAPKKQVWHTMLDAEKYKAWVKTFSEDSEFIGEWKEGAEVKFFGPNKGGIIAHLDVFKPHDLIMMLVQKIEKGDRNVKEKSYCVV